MIVQNITAIWHSKQFRFPPCLEKLLLVWTPCGVFFILMLYYLLPRRASTKSNQEYSQIQCSLCYCKLVSVFVEISFIAFYTRLQIAVFILFVLSIVRLVGIPVQEYVIKGQADLVEFLTLVVLAECMVCIFKIKMGIVEGTGSYAKLFMEGYQQVQFFKMHKAHVFLPVHLLEHLLIALCFCVRLKIQGQLKQQSKLGLLIVPALMQMSMLNWII